jgi:hypothetical protein
MSSERQTPLADHLGTPPTDTRVDLFSELGPTAEDAWNVRAIYPSDEEIALRTAERAAYEAEFRARWNDASRQRQAEGKTASFRGADGTHLTLLMPTEECLSIAPAEALPSTPAIQAIAHLALRSQAQ